jgi:Bacterial antitoxin of type II TA system, VapB
MATNLSLDPKLIEQAVKVGGERTKKAAVTRALVRGLVLGKAREKTRNVIIEKFPVSRCDPRARRMSPE